jgi:hypothetical protein
MNAVKIKELCEIAHRDSAVSLTVRAADLRALLDEVEALRAELEKVRELGKKAADTGCVSYELVEYFTARHEPKDAEHG